MLRSAHASGSWRRASGDFAHSTLCVRARDSERESESESESESENESESESKSKIQRGCVFTTACACVGVCLRYTHPSISTILNPNPTLGSDGSILILKSRSGPARPGPVRCERKCEDECAGP